MKNRIQNDPWNTYANQSVSSNDKTHYFIQHDHGMNPKVEINPRRKISQMPIYSPEISRHGDIPYDERIQPNRISSRNLLENRNYNESPPPAPGINSHKKVDSNNSFKNGDTSIDCMIADELAFIRGMSSRKIASRNVLQVQQPPPKIVVQHPPRSPPAPIRDNELDDIENGLYDLRNEVERLRTLQSNKNLDKNSRKTDHQIKALKKEIELLKSSKNDEKDINLSELKFQIRGYKNKIEVLETEYKETNDNLKKKNKEELNLVQAELEEAKKAQNDLVQKKADEVAAARSECSKDIDNLKSEVLEKDKLLSEYKDKLSELELEAQRAKDLENAAHDKDRVISDKMKELEQLQDMNLDNLDKFKMLAMEKEEVEQKLKLLEEKEAAEREEINKKLIALMEIRKNLNEDNSNEIIERIDRLLETKFDEIEYRKIMELISFHSTKDVEKVFPSTSSDTLEPYKYAEYRRKVFANKEIFDSIIKYDAAKHIICHPQDVKRQLSFNSTDLPPNVLAALTDLSADTRKFLSSLVEERLLM